MDYEKIVNKYPTPLYLYDIEKLESRIEYLRRFLGSTVNLVYAVKANTFVMPYVHSLVDRLELCSFGEYEIALKSKVPFEKMVISGVYKDEESMKKMFENQTPSKFTIESIEQWELLMRMCEKYDKSIEVLLRFTSGNQFGMSKEDLEDIIVNRQIDKVKIVGIQYFSKTQRHSLPILEKELFRLNDYMEELESKYDIKIEEFEYGPGFPVYYFEDDEFDEEEFLSKFSDILKRTIRKRKVSIELGRSVAASCGEYITRVVDMKKNETGTYAVVDGGINHIAYYGQTMAIKVPIHEIVPDRKGNDSYIICGSLCTINDILVKDFRAENLQIGDMLVFKNAGAYCSTEGISLFLSRELPRVIIKNKEEILEKRSPFKTSSLNGLN